MTNDEQLLDAYARERSESAFGELVTRHIDFVYSTALRVVNGDSHLAQDVAQTVFIDLARKAGSLPGDVGLAGWLHHHTCHTAAKAVRTERRRETREQTAMEMKALDDNTRPAWEQVAPYLDESLNQLNPADRDALVLRFLKQQDFRAVGAALGVSEDGARKRVDRALEKLHVLLKHRGSTLSAVALGTALATEAVTAAPAGLAGAVTAAALSGTTATTTAVTAATKAITMTTLQKAAITAALAMAVGTGIYEARQAANARAEVLTLQQQQTPMVEQIQQLQKDREESARQLAALRDDAERRERNPSELLKLRAEVTRLRNEMKDLGDLDKHLAKRLARTANSASTNRSSRTNVYFPSELRSAGLEKLDDAIQTCLYALSTADPDTVARVAKRESAGFEGQDLKFFQYVKSFLTNVSQIRVTSEEDFSDGSVWLSCDLQAADGDKRSFRLLDLKMHPIDGLWVLDQASPITMIPPSDLDR